MVALATLGALALRHGLIEPTQPALRCDAAPWATADCVVRSLVVQAFVHQRLGLAALAVAALALWQRSTLLAVVAAALAGAGLVLYGAGWAAPAAVLALLAWVAASRPRGV